MQNVAMRYSATSRRIFSADFRYRIGPRLPRGNLVLISTTFASISAFFECVARSGLRDAFVEMILSRGVDRHAVRDPRLFENCFYAYAIPYVWLVKPEDQQVGAHLIIARDTIRIPPQAIDPTVKNFQWGDLIRGLFEAYDQGGHTVVLPDADGNIIEGPGFNLFACHDEILLTPARGVLQGITRRTVLALAEEQGITARLDMFDADVLRAATEIFLTSTAGGLGVSKRVEVVAARHDVKKTPATRTGLNAPVPRAPPSATPPPPAAPASKPQTRPGRPCRAWHPPA